MKPTTNLYIVIQRTDGEVIITLSRPGTRANEETKKEWSEANILDADAAARKLLSDPLACVYGDARRYRERESLLSVWKELEPSHG